MNKKRELHYYKHIVKRHLNGIINRINKAENEMERNYYLSRYSVQLSIYANALNVRKKYLEKYI